MVNVPGTSIESCVLEGKFLNPYTGGPMEGIVQFRASSELLDSMNNVVLPAVTLTVELDEDGDLSIVLPVTNDPTGFPTITYQVTERFNNGASQSYSIALPYGSVSLNLADVPRVPAGVSLGISSRLASLSDVSIGSQADGEGLVWSASLGKWVPGSVGGGGGGGGLDAEAVRDLVGTLLVAGTNVTITPDDAGNIITISATGGGGGTREAVEDLLGSSFVGAGLATVSYSDVGNLFTVSVTTEAVQDAFGSMITGTYDGMIVTYDDAANALSISADPTILKVRSIAHLFEDPSVKTGVAVLGDSNASGFVLASTADGWPAKLQADLRATYGPLVGTFADLDVQREASSLLPAIGYTETGTAAVSGAAYPGFIDASFQATTKRVYPAAYLGAATQVDLLYIGSGGRWRLNDTGTWNNIATSNSGGGRVSITRTASDTIAFDNGNSGTNNSFVMLKFACRTGADTGVQVINCSRAGTQVYQLATDANLGKTLLALRTAKVKVVIIAAGNNDPKYGSRTAAQLKADTETLTAAIRTEWASNFEPVPRIVVAIGPAPSGVTFTTFEAGQLSVAWDDPFTTVAADYANRIPAMVASADSLNYGDGDHYTAKVHSLIASYLWTVLGCEASQRVPYLAKGDILVGTGAGSYAILPAGTDTHVVTYDSSTPTGLKSAAAAGGGGGSSAVGEVPFGHYLFDTGTSFNPGTGELRFNNTSALNATIIYLKETDNSSADVTPWAKNVTIGDIIVVRQDNTPGNYARFKVTAVTIDSGTYDRINVVGIGSSLGSTFADAVPVSISVVPNNAQDMVLDFYIPGVQATGNGKRYWYNFTGSDMKLKYAWVSLDSLTSGATGSPISGEALIVDISSIAGTSYFTTQAGRPSISSGQTTGGTVRFYPDITGCSNLDGFRIDVDRIGDTTPGTGLTVYLAVEYLLTG